MPGMQKIDCSQIKIGMRFSMPVFFDDGKYMFLAKKRAVKKYHTNAIQQWKIPYLLTAGTVMADTDEAMEKDFAGFAKANYDNPTDVEELDAVDDVEDLEELEELE